MILMYGDIFTSSAPAIGHGVNTMGLMGAGIALQFRDKYPELYEVYAKFCASGRLVPGGVLIWEDKNAKIPLVFNIASQELPGRNAKLAFLKAGLDLTAYYMLELGIDTIALPEIGCGIGGLGLADVLRILDDVESYYGITVELWTYQE